MTSLPTLPSPIQAYLAEFVARSRRVAVLRAAAVAVSTFLAWMLVWCVVDRYAHLAREVRLAVLAVGIAIVLFRLAPSLLALRRHPDWLAAAAEVERQNPRFAQRLVTVTSRLLGAANYRGSDEILLRLVREVDEQVAADRAATLVPLRAAVGPWAVSIGLVLLSIGLFKVPDLQFRGLAERFLNPFSNVPPVTTTQLSLSPGDRDVVQSQAVTIDVHASRLGESAVTLFMSDDDHNWSRLAMTPAAGERFTFAIAGVDRDIRYYITGGDARSPDFLLRVLRRPAVAEFRIHYEYPAYTHLPPTSVANTDGRVEAPAGTKVLLTVIATEPLQAALLTIGSERLLMERGTDPQSRQAQLVIRADAKYSVDLISTRDVAGSGPASTSIRVVPDLPPQVRLARGGDSLRLNPRDIVPVWYEALDDYGLKTLSVRSQLNGQEPVELPVRLWGDRRRQQDVFNFDLATLPLGIGDVVKLTAVATDTAGKMTESQPLTVLISPRSVDLDAYERIGELHNAAQLAQSLAVQLEDGVKGYSDLNGQADHQSTAYQGALSRADRALSSASQTATLLRKALLRATTRSHSRQLCVALAGWVDVAEMESTAADDAFRRSGIPVGATNFKRESLDRALEQSRRLQSQLNTVEQGEQAAAVLADRENLQATQKRALPKDENGKRRWRETVLRMRQDIAAEAGQLGLDPASNDLDAQLQARIRAEQELIDAVRPINFATAAREWAQKLLQDPRQRLGLVGRLSAAAQAEAIRPDADLVRARDLELASRAAGAIVVSGRGSGRMLTAPVLNEFVSDMEALQRLRDLPKQPTTVPTVAAAQETQPAAAKARQDLSRLAGDSSASRAGTARPPALSADERQKEAENLALQAGAAAADHQYQQVTALDQSLGQRLESGPRKEHPTTGAEVESPAGGGRLEHHQQAVQREMTAARQIDELGQQQQQLTQPPTSVPSAELAGRQRNVAEQIAQVRNQQAGDSPSPPGSSNGRDRTASAVLAEQEQLSSIPQALAAAQAAAAARREVAMRAEMARQAAKTAPPDQRIAAAAAAAEAARNVREATAKLSEALQSVAPKAAQQMADRLEPFAPETDGARAAITGQLAVALQSLQQALSGDDVEASDGAATEVRQAIEVCQRELGRAQDALVQHDPLVAARWFARAAAVSLSLQPPDMSHAKLHQAGASAALSRAWDQSIHRAAAERLSAIPSLAAVLDPVLPASNGPAPQQTSKFAAAREWGRLRLRDGSDVNSSMRDVDPPGYEESLKLYFEALGKAQEGK